MVIRDLMRKKYGVDLPSLEIELVEESREVALYALGDDSYTFTDPRSFEIPGDRLELAEYRTEEEGWDGTSYRMGRAYRGENPEKDYPVIWRGLRMDYGLAHRVFLGSTVYQRGVFDIINTLRSLEIRVDPADVEAELEEAAQVQAYAVEDAIKNLEGGWETFLGEAVYSLAVPGFGIWQRIHFEDGRLRRLAFRRSNALNGILLDEAGQRIVGFEFLDDSGGTYIIDASDCLVLSYMALGLDVEGLSGWRASSEYELAKQALIEIAMVAASKFGAPRDVAEVQAGVVLSEDDKVVLGEALDDHAGLNPVNLVLPPGVRVTSLRPDGPLADFLPFMRYLDEQIGLPLSAEGALFTGSSGAGSYAALDVKDRQKLSTAGAFLEIILSGLQGSTGQAFHGPLRVMIDAMGGPVDGRYPRIAIAVEEEETSLADIALAAEKGLIVVDLEVQRAIHRRLNLPEPQDATATPAAEATPGEATPETVGLGEIKKPSWFSGYTAGVDPLPQGVVLADAAAVEVVQPGAAAARVSAGIQLADQFELRSCACSSCLNNETAHRPYYQERLLLSEGAVNLFSNPLSTGEMKDLFEVTNSKIAKAFESIAQEMRREWAEATKGKSFAELIPVREEFRARYLGRFREAAMPAIGVLYKQGELSLPVEIGVIKKMPKRGALLAPVVNDAVLGMADALALKSYNITEHHLFERGRLEANGLPERKLPPIPEGSAYTSQVKAMTAPAFAIGRQSAVELLYNVSVSRAPAGSVPRMIAEYSSVMEENTCDSCAALDGLRVFVGSDEYNRIKPPSVCEGGERCRCIFTYFADEQDFEEIYQEVEQGFSQVRGFELADLSKPKLILMCGLPGSGKSTFVAENFSHFPVVSMDNLGNRKKEDQVLADLFEAGESFVVDNTNVTKQEREKYIRLAQEHGYSVECVFMDTPLEESERRNAEREKKVPAVAVNAMKRRMEAPDEAEGLRLRVVRP